MTALRLLSLCKQQRTEAALPSLTSPPKKFTIDPMGTEFASTAPFPLEGRTTLDQSCADIRIPCSRTSRAS